MFYKSHLGDFTVFALISASSTKKIIQNEYIFRFLLKGKLSLSLLKLVSIDYQTILISCAPALGNKGIVKPELSKFS